MKHPTAEVKYVSAALTADNFKNLLRSLPLVCWRKPSNIGLYIFGTFLLLSAFSLIQIFFCDSLVLGYFPSFGWKVFSEGISAS